MSLNAVSCPVQTVGIARCIPKEDEISLSTRMIKRPFENGNDHYERAYKLSLRGYYLKEPLPMVPTQVTRAHTPESQRTAPQVMRVSWCNALGQRPGHASVGRYTYALDFRSAYDLHPRPRCRKLQLNQDE